MIETQNEVDIMGSQMKGAMEGEARMILQGECRHQCRIATNREVWVDQMETMTEDLVWEVHTHHQCQIATNREVWVHRIETMTEDPGREVWEMLTHHQGQIASNREVWVDQIEAMTEDLVCIHHQGRIATNREAWVDLIEAMIGDQGRKIDTDQDHTMKGLDEGMVLIKITMRIEADMGPMSVGDHQMLSMNPAAGIDTGMMNSLTQCTMMAGIRRDEA